MSPSSDLEATLAPVVDVLDRLGVTYRIGGSVASATLGVPRSTLDIDLVCNLEAAQVGSLVTALDADYYVDAAAVRAAIAERRSFNLIHLATMMKVDVFLVRDGAYDRTSFDRHVERALSSEPGARSYSFRSPEDVVLRKLEGYRAGGEVSDRQWADTIGVLKVQGSALDRAYLERWAEALGVGDLLERAFVEAGAAD
ncbi:MAG: hypothetical protein IPK07_05355 [Deltaproteobacteria bacterium]|nr:hypothetical protein [Deltaproteobacteria bacterium]